MIIIRRKCFSEELKALIAKRMADKSAGITPTGSAASQLDQMKANSANMAAVKSAERTARRETGKALESQIKTAAQTGNTTQKTQLLNTAKQAGTNAGYQKALDTMKSTPKTTSTSYATRSTNNAFQQGQQSVGLKQGAMNTWNNMSTTGKVATGAAALGTTALIAGSIIKNKRKAKEAEEKAKAAQRY